MAYDKGLAQRVREQLERRTSPEEKKMFGGICFMVDGHMCCGILEDRLMARVGPEVYEACLQEANTAPMDFTGRPMKGMIFVSPAGTASDADLENWLERCLKFVNSLPPR